MQPPQIIPPDLKDRFLLGGKIKQEEWYINEAQSSGGIRVYQAAEIEELVQKAKARQENYYGATDTYLYTAFESFPIKGQSCVIMGSTVPWYEAICIAYEAKDITVIEYWQVTTDHPKVKFVTPDGYDKNPRQFDVGLSISSFEHDGLGRYGDPVNPDADLIAMKKMKNIIKPGGLLFLAVPVALDKVVWNAHRIYGNIRLPMLLEGWKVLAAAGFTQELLNIDTGKEGCYQPVFVLQNI